MSQESAPNTTPTTSTTTTTTTTAAAPPPSTKKKGGNKGNAAAPTQPQQQQARKPPKSKARMSSLDIRAVVNEMRKHVLGMRVANVYDINPTTYTIKMGKAGERAVVLIESAFRLHTSKFDRTKPDSPSWFTEKLRRYLRDALVDNVHQLGVDRVIEFTFRKAEHAYHLIIELYASGNILLTDADHIVLVTLRSHEYDEDNRVKAQNSYPLNMIRHMTPITIEQLRTSITEAGEKPLSDAVSEMSSLIGSNLTEHAIITAGFELKKPSNTLSSEEISLLFQELKNVETLYEQAGTENSAGFVLLESQEENARFLDFSPVMLCNYQSKPVKQFETFNDCVDQYFAKIEEQNIERQKRAQDASVVKKKDAVVIDQEERLEALRSTSSTMETQAEVILSNLEVVDQAITEIRKLLATGIQWKDVEATIKAHKRNPHSVASVIQRIDFTNNKAYLTLLDSESTPKLVEVQLDLSAHGNVQQCYQNRKKANEKAKKTEDAIQTALERAEEKQLKALKKQATAVPAITLLRKKFWFEKFHWFISSEGFIVISGKDQQQNEIVYRRYLQGRDAYIHADIHGASTCIVKNPDNREIGVTSLEQAGRYAVSFSSAWAAKIITSAWWVFPSQVSKSAPTGLYLSTGSFMIRGKKNYLPPHPHIMGIGILFILDNDSIERRRLTHPKPAPPIAHTDATKTSEETEIPDDETEIIGEPTALEGESTTTSTTTTTCTTTSSSLQENTTEIPDNDEETVNCDSTEENDDNEPEESESIQVPPPSKVPSKKDEVVSIIEPSKSKKNTGKQKPSAAAKKTPPPTGKGRGKKNKRGKPVVVDDDEETRLRMRLIGAKPGKGKSAAPEAPSNPEPQPETEVLKECFHCGKTTHLAKDCPNKPPPVEKPAPSEQNLDRENEDNEEMRTTSTILERLTGNPEPGDVLLGALPMCAPWEALQSFKYKLKLTPGDVKRGTAAKMVLNLLTTQAGEAVESGSGDEAALAAVEKALMSRVSPDEVIQCVMGDVKIAGGQASTTKKGKAKGKPGKKGGHPKANKKSRRDSD
ncbi:nuclear export mediator factor NEMF [Pelomyxa schiedti]|nr:nuclear export mediator factor NEMF [Pelomyxa schiedti]